MKENIKLSCPSCSSNEIRLNPEIGKLECKYCKKVIEGTIYNDGITDLTKLKGTHISKGASKIDIEDNPLLKYKCHNCGAEILFNSNDEYKKCHWCNTVITTKEIMEKPIIPDQILPFTISKEKAKEIIEEFISDKKLLATSSFLKKLDINNINGVYLPYFLVDINSHTNVSGKGIHEEHIATKTKLRQTFDFELDYDLTIPELLVEANNDMDTNRSDRTNKVISSIQPFDTENCVVYNPNYIIGFSVDQRNINFDEKKNIKNVDKQLKEINDDHLERALDYYNYKTKYNKYTINTIGSQWATAYLPVWIYSHCEKTNGKDIIHYIAINGRTGNISGSIPFIKKKALSNSIKKVIEILIIPYILLSIFVSLLAFGSDSFYAACFGWLIITSPFALLVSILMTYAYYDDYTDLYTGFNTIKPFRRLSKCEILNKKMKKEKIKEETYTYND
jgi:DNA-directed RNA polymerase subunit RPC12/RpoP